MNPWPGRRAGPPGAPPAAPPASAGRLGRPVRHRRDGSTDSPAAAQRDPIWLARRRHRRPRPTRPGWPATLGRRRRSVRAARTAGQDAPPGRARRAGPPRVDRPSSGRPRHRPAAEQVDVEVVHGLAAPVADVRHEPVAVRRRCPRPGRRRPRRRTTARAAAPSASVSSAAERMCTRDRNRTWVGARGAMSRIATTRSSAWTDRRRDLAGDDPAEQAVRVAASARRSSRSPPAQSCGLVLIR